MTICNYEMNETHIIGIGPLMVKRSSDQVARMFYKEMQLYFVLILQNFALTIESEWISFADHLSPEELKISNSQKLQFEESYNLAKDKIRLTI